jgi:hypothetical protein
MNARTALSLVVAALLAACSAPAEEASTFEDPTTPAPPQTLSAPTVSASPTAAEAAPAPSADAPAEPKCELGTKTDAGCEMTYEIDVDAASTNLKRSCGGGRTAYNDCTGTPIELSWKDLGDRAPKSARIEIGVSIFCAEPLMDPKKQRQNVSVNGGAIGGFNGDYEACSCNAPTTAHSFDITAAALEGYKTGGQNSLRVEGPNRCIGVGGLDDTKTVARIVVTY